MFIIACMEIGKHIGRRCYFPENIFRGNNKTAQIISNADSIHLHIISFFAASSNKSRDTWYNNLPLAPALNTRARIEQKL